MINMREDNIPFTFLQISNTSCLDNFVASTKNHPNPSGAHSRREFCFGMSQCFETAAIAYLKREGQHF
jgi:hypothetical protein